LKGAKLCTADDVKREVYRFDGRSEDTTAFPALFYLRAIWSQLMMRSYQYAEHKSNKNTVNAIDLAAHFVFSHAALTCRTSFSRERIAATILSVSDSSTSDTAWTVDSPGSFALSATDSWSSTDDATWTADSAGFFVPWSTGL